MLLAIDIENKITDFGVFDRENMLCKFSIGTDRNKSSSEIKLLIKLLLLENNLRLEDIDQIIISSVVPELDLIYNEISQKITGKNPMLISAGLKIGINIKCENPKDVGSDRIIRAVCANKINDENSIIISASTITTIDYINSKKEFLGGLILPGIDLCQKSLFLESSKLPQIEIKKTTNILGNSTTKAMQNGIYLAYKNSVRGIVEQIIEKYQKKEENTQILLTGPFINLIEDEKYQAKKVPNLALRGLDIIYNLNKKS
ncbi:type III pantothenate kinase [Anaerococcus sp. Marseille-P3625]|uniref:type III pantothenate kinase n=1 Tax=Anaerococcus sp. Marseille-P3625 TaxID=1977277 RepID=UPI000C083173|nr:type III pantothenate kinase [Anaerococcus sp. Marseille-P3625]